MSPAALPGRVAALLDLAGRVYSGHPQAELAIAALRLGSTSHCGSPSRDG